MIGNDIVDLNFAKRNSRWQEQRFLDKIYTLQEQEILNVNNFYMVWRLWSMKESVYKMAARAGTSFLFNPKAFCCEIVNGTEGNVKFKNEIYTTITKTDHKYIETTAFLQQQYLSKTFQLSNSDYYTQHTETLHHIKLAYAKYKNADYNAINIQKDIYGVPQVFVNNKRQPELISLTHHGLFGAFAISVAGF